jgi:hypothetical protein
VLSVAAVGGFTDGRGDFYDSELFHGRNILVRFSIWPISSSEVRSEQAFSAHGSRTERPACFFSKLVLFLLAAIHSAVDQRPRIFMLQTG